MLPAELAADRPIPAGIGRPRRQLLGRHDDVLQHRSRGCAIRFRLRLEQKLREVVQPVAGGTIQRARHAHRLGVAGHHIDTEMGQQELEEQAGDGMRAMVANVRGPGRWGTPDDMAELLAFLRQPQRVVHHRHRHSQRRWGDSFDDGAGEGGQPRLAGIRRGNRGRAGLRGRLLWQAAGRPQRGPSGRGHGARP